MFVLKKSIAFFLQPMNIGIFLGIIGTFYAIRSRKEKSNMFLLLSFIWIAIIHWAPFSNSLISPLENYHPSLLNVPHVKYIHVLGGGHSSNEKRSIISQDSKTSLMRLSEGIRLYQAIGDAKLIVSGFGGGDIVTQAMMQKQVAVALGVNENDILMLPEPNDTRKEAIAVKKIVKDQPFIVVTSAAHMPRSIALFNKVGLNPIPAPTDFLSGEEVSFYSFSQGGLERTTSAFHEYIGLIYYYVRGGI